MTARQLSHVASAPAIAIRRDETHCHRSLLAAMVEAP